VSDTLFADFSPKYVVQNARNPPSMSCKTPEIPQVCRTAAPPNPPSMSCKTPEIPQVCRTAAPPNPPSMSCGRNDSADAESADSDMNFRLERQNPPSMSYVASEKSPKYVVRRSLVLAGLGPGNFFQRGRIAEDAETFLAGLLGEQDMRAGHPSFQLMSGGQRQRPCPGQCSVSR